MNSVVIRVATKSTIFDPLFKRLPYPIAAALVRGIRSFTTIFIAALIASVADGSIFHEIQAIPPGQIPLLVAVISPILMGVDKWLRERGLQEEIKDLQTSGISTGPPEDIINPPPAPTVILTDDEPILLEDDPVPLTPRDDPPISPV